MGTVRVIFNRVLLSGLLLLTACGGGGGGGGGDRDGGLNPAAVDQGSAERAAAISLASMDLVLLREVIDQRSTGSAVTGFPGLAAHLLNTFTSRVVVSEKAARSGSDHRRQDCDGGYIRIDRQWDGPQEVTACDQVSNLKATLVYDGCTQEPVYLNGTVTLRETGTLCRPQAIELRFEQFDFESDPDTRLSTADLRMNFSDLAWSGSEPTRMRAALDGDISVQVGSRSFSIQLREYVHEFQEIDADTVSMTVNGSVTGYCLDGWLTLETIEPLIFPQGAYCPESGVLRVSGEGDATITFTGGGNLEIRVNAAEPTPLSCEQILGEGC